MAERMVRQNKYTTQQIFNKTKEKVKNAVLCVGNHIARKELATFIDDHRSVSLIGDYCVGRLTSVIEIADKEGLDIWISYSGEDFGEEPIENPDDIYVIRYNKTSKWIKAYVDAECRVVIISETPIKEYPQILYVKPSSRDIAEYEKVKGKFPIYTQSSEISDKSIVMKALRSGITKEEMPDNLPQWFGYNFRTSKILALCSFADQIKDTFFKHAVLSKVRYKKPISLKVPYGVKRGSN